MTNGKSGTLSYEDASFINSPDGRVLRILAEYLKPLARFRRERIQDTVVFFGSERLHTLSDANHSLELLDASGSLKPAAKIEPPLRKQATPSADVSSEDASQLRHSRAEAAVEMARYYEDARKLASLLTQWSMSLRSKRYRFVVTSGGGPGIMEAANRGASEAGGKTIGLNIRLPQEQEPNPYITPSLSLDFHYFFMRKFWFAYLAKAMVVFPGGFGTLDEMFELLTLMQTRKLAKEMTIIVYGSEYWKDVLNLDTLVKKGVIAPDDLKLLHFADTPEDAFAILKDFLTVHHLGGIKPGAGAAEETLDEESEMSLRPEITKTRR